MIIKVSGIQKWHYVEPIPPVKGTGQPLNMELEGDDLTASDGYHTFDELYKHRYALFLALCKITDNYITPLSTRIKCWKSKYHHDGTMYEGHFIMGMSIVEFQGPPTEITYHLPMKYWGMANIMIYERAPEWDGYTSDDVIMRLLKL